MRALTRRPEFLSRVALCRARLASFDPDQPRDPDGKFSDGITFEASARAGGFMVALVTDDDGLYGDEGKRYFAMRGREGGSKDWTAEHVDESILVPADDARRYADTLESVGADLKAWEDPNTPGDDDNRPAEYENGPAVVTRHAFSADVLMTGYHDRFGDVLGEGARFVQIGPPSELPWDDFGPRVEVGKASAVASGIRELLDQTSGAAPDARVISLPINYPGQPRDPDGQFSDGFMSAEALDKVTDLVDMVSEIESRGIEPTTLYGGQSAETQLFTLPDGRKIVHKRVPEWGDPEAPVRGADAEQLGSAVANALGARSARVYRADRGAAYIEFISGPALAGDDERYASGADRIDSVIRDQGVRLGLVDVLIGNQDRNLGNMIQRNDDGSLVGIDTGDSWYRADNDREPPEAGDEDLDFSFEESGRFALVNRVDPNYPASHFATEPGPDDYGSDLVLWKDNPLTPADIEETRVRLESLRSDFKRLDRERWLDYSLRVLDELAPHAKGTVSIYAD